MTREITRDELVNELLLARKERDNSKARWAIVRLRFVQAFGSWKEYGPTN